MIVGVHWGMKGVDLNIIMGGAGIRSDDVLLGVLSMLFFSNVSVNAEFSFNSMHCFHQ